ncbi:hypothetical protein NMY22_g10631 [Coprinellus aureogranulatus]|nr:hypothetical protein NMY22_g10631 [Coprinellus aureogranulatus]
MDSSDDVEMTLLRNLDSSDESDNAEEDIPPKVIIPFYDVAPGELPSKVSPFQPSCNTFYFIRGRDRAYDLEDELEMAEEERQEEYWRNHRYEPFNKPIADYETNLRAVELQFKLDLVEMVVLGLRPDWIPPAWFPTTLPPPLLPPRNDELRAITGLRPISTLCPPARSDDEGPWAGARHLIHRGRGYGRSRGVGRGRKAVLHSKAASRSNRGGDPAGGSSTGLASNPGAVDPGVDILGREVRHSGRGLRPRSMLRAPRNADGTTTSTMSSKRELLSRPASSLKVKSQRGTHDDTYSQFMRDWEEARRRRREEKEFMKKWNEERQLVRDAAKVRCEARVNSARVWAEKMQRKWEHEDTCKDESCCKPKRDDFDVPLSIMKSTGSGRCVLVRDEGAMVQGTSSTSEVPSWRARWEEKKAREERLREETKGEIEEESRYLDELQARVDYLLHSTVPLDGYCDGDFTDADTVSDDGDGAQELSAEENIFSDDEGSEDSAEFGSGDPNSGNRTAPQFTNEPRGYLGLPFAVPPFIMSKFSWSWATEEQRSYFVQIEPHFREAQLGHATATFYKALREQWFGRWPIIPELVSRGLLPPEASEEDYTLSEQQKVLVRLETEEKFKRIRMTLLWARCQHMLHDEARDIGFPCLPLLYSFLLLAKLSIRLAMPAVPWTTEAQRNFAADQLPIYSAAVAEGKKAIRRFWPAVTSEFFEAFPMKQELVNKGLLGTTVFQDAMEARVKQIKTLFRYLHKNKKGTGDGGSRVTDGSVGATAKGGLTDAAKVFTTKQRRCHHRSETFYRLNKDWLDPMIQQEMEEFIARGGGAPTQKAEEEDGDEDDGDDEAHKVALEKANKEEAKSRGWNLKVRNAVIKRQFEIASEDDLRAVAEAIIQEKEEMDRAADLDRSGRALARAPELRQEALDRVNAFMVDNAKMYWDYAGMTTITVGVAPDPENPDKLRSRVVAFGTDANGKLITDVDPTLTGQIVKPLRRWAKANLFTP